MRVESEDPERDASIRRAYEIWHERLEVDGEAAAPWHRLLFGRLDPLRDLASKRVLEIACGRGGLACRLVRASSPPPTELIAADMSTTAIAKGRAFAASLGIRTVRWIACDMHALPYPTATFDTVICCETVEHLPRPLVALAEVARVLKPGGRLLLTTPNYLGPLGLYRAYLRLRGRRFSEVGQPVNRFTVLPLTLVWLRRVGLRVTTVDAAGHYLPWPGVPPIRLTYLDWRPLRWFALHSFVTAQKP
jgi:SAM-dependent methyltransferase